MKRLLLWAFAILFLMVPSAGALDSNTITSTVYIQVIDAEGNLITGSGFFMSGDGLVMTNAHVIVDELTGLPADDIYICTIADSLSSPVCIMSATTFAYSELYDLALLSPKYFLDEDGYEFGELIQGSDLLSYEIPYADFADNPPDIGDRLSILGFPYNSPGTTVTLTEGIVSSFVTYEGVILYINSDATINFGNSGGPAYDADEKIVGVIQALSQGEGGAYSIIISDAVVGTWLYELVEQGLINEDFLTEIFSNDAVEELQEIEISTDEIFSDVTALTPNAGAIEYLKDEGIVSGYSDGSFKPGNELNRAELLKILVEGVGISPDPVTNKDCFPDVKEEWFAKYVCYAKDKGWIEGYPDGTFLPANNVNKAEAMKMMLEVFGVDNIDPNDSFYSDVPINEWFADYVLTASVMGLLEESGVSSTYSPGTDITRGQISENIYRLIIFDYDENVAGMLQVTDHLLNLMENPTQAYASTHEIFKFYTSEQEFVDFVDVFPILQDYTSYEFWTYDIFGDEAELNGYIEDDDDYLYEFNVLFDMADDDSWQVSGFDLQLL